MSNKKNVIIFTDLDGTLLDRDTYDYSGAERALDLIRSRNIPLVLASSKTRAEVEFYRNLLRNEHPFIIENGAAALVPVDYFKDIPSAFNRAGRYFVLEMGLPYSEIRTALAELRSKTGLPIRGLGDMSAEELAEISGLDLEQARLSLMREYSEPFIVTTSGTSADLGLIREAVKQLDLNLTVGEKFLHLSGHHNKGGLVRELISLFGETLRDGRHELFTVGLGDGKNDIEMLKECDCPVLLKKKSGIPDDEVVLRVPNVSIYGAGPAGWNDAVMELLCDMATG